MVPDLPALLTAARTDAQLISSNDHGEGHWLAVARTAQEIAAADAACDPQVLWLFALLHDARRESEHSDPQHGPRAARLAERVRNDGLFVLDHERMAWLVEACERHDTGVVSVHPTIGACYDSDRLQLRRVGIEPDIAYLSRPVSHAPEFIDLCAAFNGASHNWAELLGATTACGDRPEDNEYS